MVIQKHLALLGYKVIDKVTGFKGVVTSVSFDLYGCIQAIVTPEAGEGNTQEDSRWFDVVRLKRQSKKPCMKLPDFTDGAIAEGAKGPEPKPARHA